MFDALFYLWHSLHAALYSSLCRHLLGQTPKAFARLGLPNFAAQVARIEAASPWKLDVSVEHWHWCIHWLQVRSINHWSFLSQEYPRRSQMKRQCTIARYTSFLNFAVNFLTPALSAVYTVEHWKHRNALTVERTENNASPCSWSQKLEYWIFHDVSWLWTIQRIE